MNHETVHRAVELNLRTLRDAGFTLSGHQVRGGHCDSSRLLRREHRRHLESYAEPGPDGLLSVGEQGAPFRRSTFGRKVREIAVKLLPCQKSRRPLIVDGQQNGPGL